MFWLIMLFVVLFVIGASFMLFAVKKRPSKNQGCCDESLMYFGFGVFVLLLSGVVFGVCSFYQAWLLLGGS